MLIKILVVVVEDVVLLKWTKVVGEKRGGGLTHLVRVNYVAISIS